MSVNVQLANELRRISGGHGATLNQILTALGFTPASATDLTSHASDSVIHITAAERRQWNRSFSGMWDDLYGKPAIESSYDDRLVFADSDGRIIAQLDSEGFKTTEVYVSGTNIRELIRATRGFSGNYSDLRGAPNIYEDNSGELLFTDPNNYIIARLDYSGLNVAALSINNQSLVDYLASNSNVIDFLQLKNRPHIVSSGDTTTISTFDGTTIAQFGTSGLSTKNVFINGVPVSTLIAQSRFSGSYYDLYNAPAIEDDGSGVLQFVDPNGNIAAALDNSGLRVTALYIGKSAREFGIWADEIHTNFTTHKNNTTIHITAEERTAWNAITSHIAAAGLHVTQALQNKWDTHVAETIIHVTNQQKESWTTAVTTLGSHVDNNNIHITAAERSRWNSIKGFSGSYLDLTNAPDILNDEDKLFIIKDPNGYKAAEFSKDGLTTYAVFVNDGNGGIVNVTDAAYTKTIAAVDSRGYQTETQVRAIVNKIFGTIFIDAEEEAL